MWTISKKLSIKRKVKHKWKSACQYFRQQDSETDYGLKGYYNTEYSECTKQILNLWRKGLFYVEKSLKHWEQQGSLGNEWRHYKVQGQQRIANAPKLKLGDKQLRKDLQFL